MNDSISILQLGLDSSLLETRQLLLESRGYRTASFTKLSEVDRIDPKARIKLLILCDSLPLAELDSAIAFTTAKWPLLKVLVLVAFYGELPAAKTCVVLETVRGPQTFLSTVESLLEPAHPVSPDQ
jgi:hypothetical protein